MFFFLIVAYYGEHVRMTTMKSRVRMEMECKRQMFNVEKRIIETNIVVDLKVLFSVTVR